MGNIVPLLLPALTHSCSSLAVGVKKLKADLMAPLALKIYFMMRMLSHTWILKYIHGLAYP